MVTIDTVMNFSVQRHSDELTKSSSSNESDKPPGSSEILIMPLCRKGVVVTSSSSDVIKPSSDVQLPSHQSLTESLTSTVHEFKNGTKHSSVPSQNNGSLENNENKDNSTTDLKGSVTSSDEKNSNNCNNSTYSSDGSSNSGSSDSNIKNNRDFKGISSKSDSCSSLSNRNSNNGNNNSGTLAVAHTSLSSTLLSSTPLICSSNHVINKNDVSTASPDEHPAVSTLDGAQGSSVAGEAVVTAVPSTSSSGNINNASNLVLQVECGGNVGHLHVARLQQGSRGACILHHGNLGPAVLPQLQGVREANSGLTNNLTGGGGPSGGSSCLACVSGAVLDVCGIAEGCVPVVGSGCVGGEVTGGVPSSAVENELGGATWLTPNEFQYLSGRETAKDWKRSIKHYGKSLKVLLARGTLSIEPATASCHCFTCTSVTKTFDGGKEDVTTSTERKDGSCVLIPNTDSPTEMELATLHHVASADSTPIASCPRLDGLCPTASRVDVSAKNTDRTEQSGREDKSNTSPFDSFAMLDSVDTKCNKGEILAISFSSVAAAVKSVANDNRLIVKKPIEANGLTSNDACTVPPSSSSTTSEISTSQDLSTVHCSDTNNPSVKRPNDVIDGDAVGQSKDVATAAVGDMASVEAVTETAAAKKPKRKRKKNKSDIEQIVQVSCSVHVHGGRQSVESLVTQHTEMTSDLEGVQKANAVGIVASDISATTGLILNASATPQQNVGLFCDKFDSFKSRITVDTAGQDNCHDITNSDPRSGLNVISSECQSLQQLESRTDMTFAKVSGLLNIQHSLTNSCFSPQKLCSEPTLDCSKQSVRTQSHILTGSTSLSLSCLPDFADLQKATVAKFSDSSTVKSRSADGSNHCENISATKTATFANGYDVANDELVEHDKTSTISRPLHNDTVDACFLTNLQDKNCNPHESDRRMPNLVECNTQNSEGASPRIESGLSALERLSFPMAIKNDLSLTQQGPSGESTADRVNTITTTIVNQNGGDSAPNQEAHPEAWTREEKEYEDGDGEDIIAGDHCARIDFMYDITKRKQNRLDVLLNADRCKDSLDSMLKNRSISGAGGLSSLIGMHHRDGLFPGAGPPANQSRATDGNGPTSYTAKNANDQHSSDQNGASSHPQRTKQHSNRSHGKSQNSRSHHSHSSAAAQSQTQLASYHQSPPVSYYSPTPTRQQSEKSEKEHSTEHTTSKDNATTFGPGRNVKPDSNNLPSPFPRGGVGPGGLVMPDPSQIYSQSMMNPFLAAAAAAGYFGPNFSTPYFPAAVAGGMSYPFMPVSFPEYFYPQQAGYLSALQEAYVAMGGAGSGAINMEQALAAAAASAASRAGASSTAEKERANGGLGVGMSGGLLNGAGAMNPFNFLWMKNGNDAALSGQARANSGGSSAGGGSYDQNGALDLSSSSSSSSSTGGGGINNTAALKRKRGSGSVDPIASSKRVSPLVGSRSSAPIDVGAGAQLYGNNKRQPISTAKAALSPEIARSTSSGDSGVQQQRYLSEELSMRPPLFSPSAADVIARWTVDEVTKFIADVEGCAGYAEVFRRLNVTGSALPFLTVDHMTQILGLRADAALRLRSAIDRILRHPPNYSRR